ncbi:MAG: HAMP domain-containing histidine kinase [Elusimicrobia bacterium]|nr:HAMP domain-containing histidine kinase [Elusimicrobiota bacterium]
MTAAFASSNLRGIAVRSHLLILGVLLGIFTLVSAASFWYREQSENELESSLQQNLWLLTKLPELRGGIRQIDLLTVLYLKTDESHWLDKRAEAVAQVRESCGALKALSAAAPAQGLLLRFDGELNVLLDRQRVLIEARARGAPVPDRRAAEDLRSRSARLLELIASFGDHAAVELQTRALQLEKVSRRLHGSGLAFEISVAGLLTLYLLFFIVRPLRVAEELAAKWKLGEPWPAQSLVSIPEVRRVIARFEQMAGRLNAEYGKAEELSRFKTDLVAVVSHEFGNTLTIIKNAIFLIEERLPENWLDENRRLFGMIQSNADALSLSIQNLLGMGRLEAGKLAVNFKPTDVGEILRSTFARQELLCEEKRLRVTIEIPEGLRPLRADPAALTLVVSNLLGNAIKYTPADGRISLGVLRVDERPGYFRIYVDDTGIGISTEERAKILSGYFRSESGKRMTMRGFGVGLSLSRQIIEAHDSEIEIEGSPGKGSRFSFVLPQMTDGGRIVVLARGLDGVPQLSAPADAGVRG